MGSFFHGQHRRYCDNGCEFGGAGSLELGKTYLRRLLPLRPRRAPGKEFLYGHKDEKNKTEHVGRAPTVVVQSSADVDVRALGGPDVGKRGLDCIVGSELVVSISTKYRLTLS